MHMEGPIVLCSPKIDFPRLIANGFVVFTTSDDADDSNLETYLAYLAASLVQQNQLRNNVYLVCSTPCFALIKLLKQDGVLAQRAATIDEVLQRKEPTFGKGDKLKQLQTDAFLIYRQVRSECASNDVRDIRFRPDLPKKTTTMMNYLISSLSKDLKLRYTPKRASTKNLQTLAELVLEKLDHHALAENIVKQLKTTNQTLPQHIKDTTKFICNFPPNTLKVLGITSDELRDGTFDMDFLSSIVIELYNRKTEQESIDSEYEDAVDFM